MDFSRAELLHPFQIWFYFNGDGYFVMHSSVIYYNWRYIE